MMAYDCVVSEAFWNLGSCDFVGAYGLHKIFQGLQQPVGRQTGAVHACRRGSKWKKDAEEKKQTAKSQQSRAP